MSIEDSIIGGGRDFDPRSATADLARSMTPDLPPGSPVDVRSLNTRIARKLGQPAPPDIPLPDAGGPLDFSAEAAPAAAVDPTVGTTDKTLDFSQQAEYPPAMGPDLPPAAPTSLMDYPTEFGKGAAEGVKNMGASALKGIAALPIPATAEGSLLDDLVASKDMDAKGRASLMSKVMKSGIPKPLQMDYNAALRRVAAGGDPAAEVATLKPKFNANNEAANTPVTDLPLYKAGQAIEDYGKETLAPKPGFESGKSWTRDLGSGAGSMAAGILTSMVPGIGPVAAGTLFTAAGMGEATENAVKGGATPQQTRQAAQLGGVAGATDMIDTLLPMLGSTGKAIGFLKRVGIAAVKGAMIEGGQEGVQQLMQNAIAKGIYKPDQDLFEDVPRSVALAAILGGVGGGASGIAHSNETTPAPAAGESGGGAGSPGGEAGAPPPGSGPSSPEDVADFVRRAKESAPPNPDTMSEAERINAYAEARASHDGASDTEILKSTGMDEATIAGLSEQDRIDAVIRAAKGNAQSNADSTAAGTDEPAAAKPRAQEHADSDYSVLRAYGYDDADIEVMSERQRRREAADAIAEGVDPVAAAEKFKRPTPAEATPDTATSESDVATRSAPVTITTADDVAAVTRPAEADYTHAQGEANNRRLGHGKWNGLDVSMEVAKGGVRKMVNPETGDPVEVSHGGAAYGYIKGTKGADGMHVDLYMGDNPASPDVYVIDEKDRDTGAFRQHKIMGGFDSERDAFAAYVQTSSKGPETVDHITKMSVPEMKEWLAGDTTQPLKKNPTAEAAGVEVAPAPSRADTRSDKPTTAKPIRSVEDMSDEAVNRFSSKLLDRLFDEDGKRIPEITIEPSQAIYNEMKGAGLLGDNGLISPEGAQRLIAEQARRAAPKPAAKPKIDDVPLSLLQFLASKGGLKPHGDLTAMDAHRHRVQIPGKKGFFGLVKSSGLPLDMAREAAEEAGYLRGEEGKTSTERDLLDAIDAEMRGQKLHAEGEEPVKTKREVAQEDETRAAERDNEIAAARRDIDTEYPGMPADLLDAAATIMFDENLDIDSAVEQAAMRVVNEDADYEISHNDIADTFGEGVFDEIQARPAPEDGGDVEPASAEERGPGEGEEAGGAGERVPAARKEKRQGENQAEAERRRHLYAVERAINDRWHDLIDVDSTDTRPGDLFSAVRINLEGGSLSTENARKLMEALEEEEIPHEESIDILARTKIEKLQGGEKIAFPYKDEHAQGRMWATIVGMEDGYITASGKPTKKLRDLIANPPAPLPPARLSEGLPVPRDQKFLEVEGKSYPLNSYEEASRAYTAAIDGTGSTATGQTGPKAPTALIKDGTGKTVGYISYNGKVWEGDPDNWSNDTTRLLYDPYGGPDPYASIERTSAGDQRLIPSTEKIGDGELAQRKADTGLKPKAPQKPADDGLFGDSMDQRDLMDMVEQKLGADADKVAPVDIARAAEIMEANPGMEPETAFGQAVVETAVEQGFITEQEAIEAYGEEVTDVLEAGREGAPRSGGDAEQESPAAGEVGAGGAAEAGIVPSGGETGAAEEAGRGRAVDTASAPEATERPAADGNKGADGAAAEDTDNANVEPPEWSKITAALPLDPAGHKDMELAARLMFEISGIRQPSFNDLTPSQKVELLARLKPQEKADGISPRVLDGDAAAGTEDVSPAARRERAGPASGAESARSGEDVPGDAGRRDAGEGSRGADAGSDVPVSERGQSEAGREAIGEPEQPDSAAVVGDNYRIQPGSLGEGRGPKAKAEGNIAAIKLANRLVADGTPATLAEQHVLASYVGWGGLKNAFPDADGNLGKGFEKVGAELQEILTPEEYDTARRSIQYAHYTAENVITAMWKAAEKLGFKGGSVFEPGMGVGHFAGLMPADVAAISNYSGVEMDHVSARIAKLLYPQWGVRREDFTRMPLSENAYDLAIGNPPFADIAIQSDPKYKQGFLLHDYFFAKSLDAVRPSGVLMFVTSAGTMNKLDSKAREYFADRAELVGAIRLPGNAFKENAGTEVTTDIVVLRKRMPGEAAGDRTWTETAAVTLPGPDGKPMKGQISRYFAEHPEMVLGEGDFADKLYEGRYSVKAPKGYNLTAALAKAIDSLPDNVMQDAETPTQRAEMDFDTGEKKDGSFYIKDGKLMQQRDGAGFPVAARGKGVEGGKSAAEIERIRGLVPIRDALRETFAADLADNAPAGNAARVKLNNAYDAFVAKFGPINKAEISRRRPNSIQQESARSEAREEARYADQHFDEGSFDPTRMIDEGKSLSEIARARADARERLGDHYTEGSFDPELMPDIIINKRPNIAPFADDQENYRLRAIEHYDEMTGRAEKGPAFSKNIITKDRAPEIKSTNDAALYVLNQASRLDIDRISALVGKSPTEVIEEMGERIYRTPGTANAWETRQKYLSGNVRKKLAVAQAAARKDPTLRRNVDALEAAQPAPLAPSQIGASLGMPWIPSDVIEQFATDGLGLEKLKASYTPALASWSVSGDTDSVAAVSTWGTNRRNATALLTDALNRQNPKIYDQIDHDTRELNVVATQAAAEKMQAIRDKFNEWVFSDEKRADRLATYYNENYNNLVVQEFDGDYLTTPGITAGWSWRPHQKRVIARIIQNGNTYMAHAVGAGKTSAMIGAGMEMRRLGLVKKPMYAVPNHMLGQFTKEFYEQYPTARIMVADDRQFHTDRRKQFMANVAVSDLDAVIITHSSFGMIPVSDDFKDQIIAQQVAEYRTALADMPAGQETRITRARIEKQIERLTQRLSGKSNRKTDKVFTFDQMGVDFLFVDEAHNYRKLDFTTQMSNLKGITPEGSGMAWDLYMKTLWLESKNPGRSLVQASGTPVTNTMAELYTISRYLQMHELEERGLKQFDAWAGAFGENVTELEQDAAGGYKPVSRFAKFVNVAELSAMVRQVMDVVTSRQLEQYVVRPKIKGGKRKLHLAEQSRELIDYNDQLAARMKAMQGRGKPQKGDDIMLTVINDGRHAAIDMRLVGGSKSSVPSKLDMMIGNMFDTWKATKAQKFFRAKPDNSGYDMSKPVDVGPATQMAFVNLGISGARGLAVPDYIRAELVRRGVPRTEIALISDYKNHVAKQKLFNDMNEGKVRFLIGSVAKMGTGVNAQRRLYAIHNMDPLWYPSDDEQRNGRALRQGNWNPEIEINDYAAKGTYDSTMWGMMEKKARFIQAFFEGDPSLRSMEDLGEASQYEQAKALTTNDPRLMRLTEMRQEMEKANRRKSAFDNDRYAIRQRRAQEKSSLEYYEGREADIRKDIAQRVALAGEAFKAKVGKTSFDKRVDFAEALIARLEEISTPANSSRHITIGEISGFSIVATPQKMGDEMAVNMDLVRNGGAQTHINGVGTGAVRSMEATIGGFDNELKEAQRRIEAARKFLKDSETDAAKKFTGGSDMETLASEIRQLQSELSAKKEDPPATDESLASMADLTPRAQSKRPELEKLVRAIMRHLVGSHVKVETSDSLIPMNASAAAKWGNIENVGARGMYRPWRRLIQLALLDGVDSTAFHESYHAIEYQLQTPEERVLMESETPRLREYVSRSRPNISAADLAGIDDVEIRAIAFEDYATDRSRGKPEAGKGMPTGIRAWFERLFRALRRLRNGLRNMGFQTYEDIFEKAYRGDYADASGATPREEVGPRDEALASMGGRRGPPPIDESLTNALAERNLPRLAAVSRALGGNRANLAELRTRLQDRFIRVRNAERAAGAPEKTYQAESLYYGRTGEQLETLEREHFDPLIKDMKARDIGLEDMNEYLYAKHAPERNRAMDAINHPELMPGGRDLRGRGSGMSDEEAQAVMDRINAEGKMADYEAVESRVRQIINDTREGMVTSGLISQETADAWAEQYEFYVPLQGFEEGTEDEAFAGRGQGFDTRARETKQAFGRLSRADGPLPYIMMQAEKAIVRGEKNKVGNAWLRFVRTNPNPERWTIDTPPTKKVIDKSTGLVTTVQDPNWQNDPNIFVTKIGGRPHLIQMPGPDGANLVRALKNLGSENLNDLLKMARFVTTTMSRLATQWNPDFIVPNLVRDLGEAYINMGEQQQAGFIKAFTKHLPRTFGGVFRGLQGSTATDAYTRAFLEFDKAGGRIRFFGLDNAVDIEKGVTRKLQQLEGGAVNNALAAGRKLAEGFDLVNSSMENATRLAAYMAARDVGMTAADAAMMARGLTVDFNKRGELGAVMNSLYMFSNVAFQGARRNIHALKHPNVRRAVYGLIALGALSAMLGYASGGDDDSGESYYKRLKDWERDKNLIIMFPKGMGKDGGYIKIPLPFGFNMFKVAGDRLAGVAMGKDKPTEALWAILKSIGDAFNPLGEESVSLFSLFPSALRPGLHVETNKNWNGNTIYPQNQWEKDKPESEQSKRNTSPIAKEAARMINSATGGNPYKPGALDWHPDSIQHIFESITGGLGKFFVNSYDTARRAVKGEDFDVSKAPIVRRFAGSVNTPQGDAGTYYAEREEARKNGGDAIKRARKDRASGTNRDAAESFLADNSNSARGEQIFKTADERLKPLFQRQDRIKASDDMTSDAKQAALADTTNKIRAIQNGARRQYRELKERASP